MSFDVVMIAVIIGGLILSAVYVAEEYRSWREHGAAQKRRDAVLRDLHAASFSEQRESLLPSVVKLQGFGEGEAANPDSVQRTARPGGPQTGSAAYSLADRRKRVRKSATPA
jgi:hypothetical protein